MRKRSPAIYALPAMLALLLLVVLPVAGQQASRFQRGPSVDAVPLFLDRGSAALWQSLMKLRTRASLLMVTAHPDDEDGGMLAYEARGMGVHTSLITLNRGEGGQNLMSRDFWDALGLVRTEELLAADRYYGVDQHWTRVADYGFSKSKDEAFGKWGHERVLRDVVRVVRMTRPLVMTSVFVGGPSDGHGHHQVAGQIAQEAYAAAGDPARFPEQIAQGIRPWAPLKMYARNPLRQISDKGIFNDADRRFYPVRFFNYVTGTWSQGKLSSQVEISEGSYDPLLGLSFRQISRLGLGFQKSQNGGTGFPEAEPAQSPYHRFASRVTTSDRESSFFDGIDTSLPGIATLVKGPQPGFLKEGLKQLQSLVDEAIEGFSVRSREKSAPLLARGLTITEDLMERISRSSLSPDSKDNVLFELRRKQEQFQAALGQALGLSIRAVVSPAPRQGSGRFPRRADSFKMAIPGQSFWVRVHLANQGSLSVHLKRLLLQSPADENWTVKEHQSSDTTLEPGHAVNLFYQVTLPEKVAFTRPYFERPNLQQPYYTLSRPGYATRSTVPYPLSARAEFEFREVTVPLAQVVQTSHRMTGPGQVLNPLAVGPAISVWISPAAGVVPLDTHHFDVQLTLHSNVKGAARGTLHLELPQGWTSSPSQHSFATAKDGEDQTFTFAVHAPRLQEREYRLQAVAKFQGREYREGYRRVGYRGLRPYYLYRNAEYRARGVDVRTAPDLRVGYIMGTGDDVPESLQNLGVKTQLLDSADLATGDLSSYDVIILGVRAYAAREDVKTYNSRLLDYVKQGGMLLVQYNTSEFDHNYGPFPYQLTNNPEKVIDEEAPVHLLKPDHPLLSWPNRIRAADFNGWVEERGHSFMKTWDSHYTALLEMHDPDQPAQEGGLLFARYGKGIYVYVALALYRQLPEGVRGAYRLFANLVSLPKNPNLKR